MSAQPQSQYAGFRPETFVAPPEQDFLLPDNTPVHVVADDNSIAISLAGAATPTIVFEKQERTLRTSPHGIGNDDRAEHAPVLLVKAPARATVARDDLWAALYALCIRRYEDDVIPAALDDSLENALKCVTHSEPTPVLLFGDNAWNQRESKYANIKDELSFAQRLEKEGGREFWKEEVARIPEGVPLTRVRDWQGVIQWVEQQKKEGRL